MKTENGKIVRTEQKTNRRNTEELDLGDDHFERKFEEENAEDEDHLAGKKWNKDFKLQL